MGGLTDELTGELAGPSRTTAFAAAAVVGMVALLALAVMLVSGPGSEITAASNEGGVAPQLVVEELPHLRVHLTVPLHVIPGHEQRAAVSVSHGSGAPLDADDALLVSAVLRSSNAEDAGVVLLGESTWSTTAGALARQPIRFLSLGDPACGEPAAELTVLVRSVGEEAAVETTKPLDGPPCDGPEVVAAPASVNIDVPVRYDPRWRETVDRILDPTIPAPRATTRSAPQRSAPAPAPAPSEAPASEPAEEPSETPTAEPTEEPSEKPEPKPEPTEDPKPKPEPTEDPAPKPEPTVAPEPKPSSTDDGSSDAASSSSADEVATTDEG